jgi:phenylalanyl-tRNA synthetase beta chain
MNNSLTKAAYSDYDEDLKSKLVYISNPLSSDLNIYRYNMLFGGLESLIHNINRKRADLKFFEFGNCYSLSTPGTDPLSTYVEKHALSLLICGNQNDPNWNTPEKPVDFFELKKYIEMIFQRLGFQYEPLPHHESENKIYSQGITFGKNNTVLAEAGIVHPSILKQFEIETPVYYAEFNWDSMLQNAGEKSCIFHEIPKYPEVKRDLALLIDKNITFKQIEELAYKTEHKLLRDVSLFDVYESEKLGHNKKSYAVSFILQDDKKTLTDKHVDKVMNQLISAYRKNLNAEIR